MTTDPPDGSRPPASPVAGSATAANGSTRGALAAALAYAMWGLVPLFWPLVKRAGAIELLAHRIAWSALLGVLLVGAMARRRWRNQLRGRGAMPILVLAAAVISVNWGTYIYAVNSGQVVQAALGYYINPILSILVGVLALSERLAPAQWIAIGLAGVAVAVLTIEYGHLPWIALLLATSFATYGVLKKRVRVEAMVSLAVESLILLLPAVGYLGWLAAQGRGTFGRIGLGYDALLACTGVVTAVPLLLFSYAAPRIALSTMGMLQYLGPTLQFLLGWLYFHEQLSPGRWVGFILVWIALTILSVHALLRARAGRRKPVAAPPTAS